MRKTRFQKVTACVLAFVFLIFGSFGVLGAESGGAISGLDNIADVLNTDSYDIYCKENAEVPRASEGVVIDAMEKYTFTMADGTTVYNQDSEIGDDVNINNVAHIGEYDGRKGLYTPGTGTVSWTTDKITTAAKYSIVIDYYAVANKSTVIERTFAINGEVPFSEARYLNISKTWKNSYVDGEFIVPEDENADSYLAKAAEVGISARAETREDGTYIIYKMPETWTKDVSGLVDDQVLRFFIKDIDRNEIRSNPIQAPEWSSYEFRDSKGFSGESFEFVLAPDDNGIVTLSLKSVSEPVVISSIRLIPHEGYISYDEYIKKYEGAPEGTDKIKIEAEYFSSASSQTIYPIEDRTSPITSPATTDRTVINVIGGEKWQTPGQWVAYQFTVGSSGLYEIATRYKQEILEGAFVYRALYIYSDSTVAEGEDGYYDGIPFAEAFNMRFGYDTDWQSDVLNDGEEDAFKFYFKEGVVYTIKFEVGLGSMGQIVRTVQASLNSINEDYLKILQLTGNNPDSLRDYGFNRIMPEVMIDLIIQSRKIYAVAENLAAVAGGKSSMTATLEKVARLLETMGMNEDQVAKNLGELKSNIGSLGTWLNDANTQPLTLDFISIQGESEELPEAEAGFFKAILFEFSKFISSFFRNYDRMGALTDIKEGEAVEVWVATGRDQSQVIRNLINSGFTPYNNIAVDLKLIAAGTLLPSILSNKGPDVYIGLSQDDVINYAIRGALLRVEGQEDFDTVIQDFNEAAMIVLGIEDSNGDFHYYGLPYSQTFSMMFLREDVLTGLGIEVPPRTWDDVLAAVPILQANNMEIGMHMDYNVFLYQMGGEQFADHGMRINLDSNVALDAFNTMCGMFTKYSFPYAYDGANRFRTGEMPIMFGDYVGTYNQLEIFATEIEGLWSFYPMPGYERDGVLYNYETANATAVVMVKGCDREKEAWEYMKWSVGPEYQVGFANEMVALMGNSAKQSTANMRALKEMPWTNRELALIEEQFNNLVAIPNYPGSYIIGRYTNFAFLAAYNDNADPITELQRYITTINKEITRKRAEYELETLDYVGQTLAQKRMSQALDVLEDIKDSSAYNASYDVVYNRAINAIDGGDTEDYASLRSAASALEEANAAVFADAIKYMRNAADSLESYEAYK